LTSLHSVRPEKRTDGFQVHSMLRIASFLLDAHGKDKNGVDFSDVTV